MAGKPNIVYSIYFVMALQLLSGTLLLLAFRPVSTKDIRGATPRIKGRRNVSIANDPRMSMGLNALTRELHANERPHLLTHLLALDAEDRHLRFGHVLSDDGVRHYVEGIDLTRDAVFVVTDTDLAVIGAAHLAREEDMPNWASPSCRRAGAKESAAPCSLVARRVPVTGVCA